MHHGRELGALKRFRIAYILNLCLALLEVLAPIWMSSGLVSGVLTTSGAEMFKFFTIDSNVLMGIIALFTALQLRQVIRGQREDLSTACYVWYLAGTVGVTLTMLVTVFFLEPTMAPQFGLFALFAGSNFLLHLFNPLLAIVTFTVFEKTRKIPFRHTLTGIVPMVLYAVFYLANCMRHAVNGMVDIAYDWYGFLAGGVKTVWIVIPVIFLFTWLISIALWRLNRRKTEK